MQLLNICKNPEIDPAIVIFKHDDQLIIGFKNPLIVVDETLSIVGIYTYGNHVFPIYNGSLYADYIDRAFTKQEDQ